MYSSDEKREERVIVRSIFIALLDFLEVNHLTKSGKNAMLIRKFLLSTAYIHILLVYSRHPSIGLFYDLVEGLVNHFEILLFIL